MSEICTNQQNYMSIHPSEELYQIFIDWLTLFILNYLSHIRRRIGTDFSVQNYDQWGGEIISLKQHSKKHLNYKFI